MKKLNYIILGIMIVLAGIAVYSVYGEKTVVEFDFNDENGPFFDMFTDEPLDLFFKGTLTKRDTLGFVVDVRYVKNRLSDQQSETWLLPIELARKVARYNESFYSRFGVKHDYFYITGVDPEWAGPVESTKRVFDQTAYTRIRKVKLEQRRYAFFSRDSTVSDSSWLHIIYLTDMNLGLNQILIIKEVKNNREEPFIIWSGDIDKDKQIDVLLMLPDKKQPDNGIMELFLSSYAQEGEIAHLVATSPGATMRFLGAQAVFDLSRVGESSME